MGSLLQLIDGITKTVFTLVLSLASVSFGAHLAKLISPKFPALSAPGRVFRYGITIVSVLTYAATFPAYFRLPADFRHKATAALLFSFPGTLTRYLLSIHLNPLVQTIPLGTFIANALGTALLGTFHVLQSTPTPVSQNACAILQGLADGYCGCMTTVSTFAAEVGTMKEWRAWFYAAFSWTTGQLLLLVILGPSFWAGHVKEQQTCSFA
jgi:CrcB protein